jgi:two-component system chemotaxis response regulator CheY
VKILIAEDDFVCRTLIQELLKKYGVCHVATDGKEAVTAFEKAMKAGEPYDLACLDIMMPEMDGQQALREIRKIEQENGIGGSDCTKIIMTTALDDAKNIMSALIKGSADGYLNKPIRPEQLEEELDKLGFKPGKE